MRQRRRILLAGVAAAALLLVAAGGAVVTQPVLIRDVNPGATGSDPSELVAFVKPGTFTTHVMFRADDGSNGLELWASDGSTGGTQLVADIAPGPGGSAPTGLSTFGRVLFSADDGVTGREPWKSDGTPSGTGLVRDVVPGAGSSNPKLFSGSYFAATTPATGYELWKTDLTAPGTQLVKDIRDGAIDGITVDFPPVTFTTVGSQFTLFVADDGTNGAELWRTNGRADGTFMVEDINPGGSAIPAQQAAVHRVGNNVFPPIYFVADDGTNGLELWRSDGTPGGTYLVADVCPGSCSSNPSDIQPSGVYFAADDGTNGRELWKSTGAPGNATLFKDINPTGSSNPASFEWSPTSAYLYFAADDGVNGRELWRTDGTSGGTAMVVDINPTGSSDPDGLVGAFGSILYAADDGPDGRELWATDDNGAGSSRMMGDINPGPGDSDPRDLTELDTSVVFSADDTGTNRELWGVAANPTAVTLRSFAARRVPGGVVVRWRTGSEAGVAAFDVFRSQAKGRVRVNRAPLLARGGARGRSYSVRDARAGRAYWLRVTRLDGTRSWFGPVRPA